MEVVLLIHENVRGAELVIVGGTCLRIDARNVVHTSAGQRHRPLTPLTESDYCGLGTRFRATDDHEFKCLMIKNTGVNSAFDSGTFLQ